MRENSFSANKSKYKYSKGVFIKKRIISDISLDRKIVKKIFFSLETDISFGCDWHVIAKNVAEFIARERKERVEVELPKTDSIFTSNVILIKTE